MNRRDILALALIVLGVVLAASGGGISASGTAERYAELEQPSWAPPSWLFGPVWTVLYIAIAWVGWRIWQTDGWGTNMQLWTAQMVLNALWTPLFFALGWRAIALAEILLLLATIIWLTVRTWRLPGAVLIPYAAWVTFASCLNAAIWWLNRG